MAADIDSRDSRILEIENAELVFTNFEGRGDRFNTEGNRNFCVFIDDPATVDALKDDLWNVRSLPGRNEGDPDRYYIRVRLNYRSRRPPRVYLITDDGTKETLLNEDSVKILDNADIKTVDLSISPYHYNVNGKEGTSGYLNEMYVTLYESKFSRKYSKLAQNNDDIPVD